MPNLLFQELLTETRPHSLYTPLTTHGLLRTCNTKQGTVRCTPRQRPYITYMLGRAVAALACGWLSLQAHPAARRGRLRDVRCGATAELCEQRFGLAAADALRVEQKLPEDGVTLSAARQRCDALQAKLSLSDVQLMKVVTKFPSVLAISHEDRIEPLLAQLQVHLDLTSEQLQKVVVSRPPVLGLSYEVNLMPSLTKLQDRLNLTNAQLQKVVVGLPQVLGLSYEANLEPSLAKLQARLGLSEAELQAVVVSRPPVLGYSYDSNLEPKLDFLQAELGPRQPVQSAVHAV